MRVVVGKLDAGHARQRRAEHAESRLAVAHVERLKHTAGVAELAEQARANREAESLGLIGRSRGSVGGSRSGSGGRFPRSTLGALRVDGRLHFLHFACSPLVG